MSLVLALGTDLVAIVILAYVLYFRRHRRRDLLLSYVALNIGVVAVTLALGSVEVGVGLGMGLFGILSIIRLRSDQITQQEIAYYFTALALGLLAGLHPDPAWLTPTLSALVLVAIAVLDSPMIASSTHRHTLTLDRAITDQDELIAHLADMFAADTVRAEVLDIDLVRDTTLVDVRYKAKPHRRSQAPQTSQTDHLADNHIAVGTRPEHPVDLE
ncbi:MULTISPECIES: DUF4956 domain-containing protein [unclassified Brevibacterium]|uniref:DUF4956 domain-containing protein n=1 Tax=unclassified Brevibacterium TaxID=2614124 RepID=UPI000C593268|nr:MULTISPECIES: DUF4956 domain-containing protein [unclassified Brevibacterium]SMX90358.1 protein of unknown function (DUF4956) [Brevibacterium sp. 239c]